jgi:predicted nucleic acid-binding protein
VVVVDASAFAAIAFSEPHGERVLAQLEGADALTAPAIFPFELASAAWTKMRARPAEAPALRDNLADALQRRVVLRRVDFVAVVELALRTNLTAYDASYLWLARSLGVPLVTLDRKLAAHAETV